MKCFVICTFLVFSLSAFVNAQILDSTNIALVVIDTKGQTIVDEPKIAATIKIFYKGPGKMNRVTDVPAYSGNIGIEIRGSYSASLPQKSYGFETTDAAGNSLNVSLLGLPSENDWILLANYNDKSFVRANIAYNAFLEMGHWASRSRHCEVIINNTYMGIYTLLEKIKRDKSRVNIEKMDENANTGNSLTGGYIFKHDNNAKGELNWNSSFGLNFIYVYPKPDEITSAQANFLKNYINNFENALSGSAFDDPVFGYKAYINPTSFYDYFIIGELSRNVDAYKKSSFWNKDNIKDGGLLNAGPVWDFDWAFKNLYDGADECFCRNLDGSGWAYQVADCGWGGTPADWMERLLNDTTFANNLHHRYFQLRKNILSEKHLFAYIDSVQNLLNEPQKRHYKKWPILGINVGAPEIDDFPKTYKGEVTKLKNWLSLRLAWLDENMVGREPFGIPAEIANNTMFTANFKMFPNPCKSDLFIESAQEIESVAVCGIDGKMQLLRPNIHSNDCYIDVSALNRNLYVIKVIFTNGKVNNAKLMVE